MHNSVENVKKTREGNTFAQIKGFFGDLQFWYCKFVKMFHDVIQFKTTVYFISEHTVDQACQTQNTVRAAR